MLSNPKLQVKAKSIIEKTSVVLTEVKQNSQPWLSIKNASTNLCSGYYFQSIIQILISCHYVLKSNKLSTAI